MKCSSCGADLKNGAKFCQQCGATVTESAASNEYATISADTNSAYFNSVNSASNTGAYAAPVTPGGYAYGPGPNTMSMGMNMNMGMGRHILPTDYTWWKLFLLSLITLGIYPLIKYDRMIADLNITAFKHDGERTFSMMTAGFLGGITMGIYLLVWYHTYLARMQKEIQRRGIQYKIGPADFWIFGILLFWTIVCPFILLNKVCTATNKINADYNMKGE